MFRKRFILCFVCLLSSMASLGIAAAPPSATQASTKKNTVCLNMIVKNEKDVIRECLTSVKGLIDYWVIVDTGSTDGTQQIILDVMKDIPGHLYERPWINFGHNRNEALQLAKNHADYTLFIDADEVLSYDKNFHFPVLNQDVYYITVRQKDSSDYLRWFLAKNTLNWQWKGVLHENLDCPDKKTESVMQGIVNLSDTSRGARSKDPQKYLHDAKVLEMGLRDEPDNTRYQFYLAQSYANAGELCLALEEYQKRIAMDPGYIEEVFISFYIIARIQEVLHMPSPIVINSYERAHMYIPSRVEPLFYLGIHYMKENNYTLAYETLKKAVSVRASPTDHLFIEQDIYDWKAQSCLAEVCWKLQKIDEMLAACAAVANCPSAPQQSREEMKKNIAVVQKMLQQPN